MNEQEINPDRVEQAIKLGRIRSHGELIVYNHSIKKGFNFIWVALDKSGNVVLVGN